MAMTLELSHQPMHPIFIPWRAGTSRHERLVREQTAQGASRVNFCAGRTS